MPNSKGKPIDRKTANQEISDFRTIKKNLLTAINSPKPIQIPIDAAKYFIEDAASFIFDASLIKAILTLGESKNGNALRVYFAASNGLPTVVLIPAIIETDATTGEIKSVENIIYSDELAGIEYPGIMKEAGNPFDILTPKSVPKFI